MSLLCEHCGKMFLYKYSLKGHIGLHHAETAVTAQPHPYPAASASLVSTFWQPWINKRDKTNI
jgi:hypothetical protein